MHRRLAKARVIVERGPVATAAAALAIAGASSWSPGRPTPAAAARSVGPSTVARPSIGDLPLAGVPLRGRTSLRLLVADAPAPFIFDVDRGTVQRISGLPTQGDRETTVLPVGRHALVLSYCFSRRCPPASGVYVLRRGSTKASRLGTALQVVASRDGRGAWMLSRRAAGRCALREVRLDGRPRRAAKRVSCRTGLVAELPAGLLVNFAGPGGTNEHSALLRPDGRVVRFRDWQAQPVVGNLVLSGTDRRTPLLLHNMASGASHRLPWPARPDYRLGEVTGQPNGRLATIDFAQYSPVHRYDLWLLDTTTRRWRHLPEMPARVVPKTTDVEWTRDGRAVVLAYNALGVWRPGEARLAVRRVKAPKQPGVKFVIW